LISRFAHEYIILPAAVAVHADCDSISLWPPGEGFTGEMAILVGVEDLWFSFFKRDFFQRQNEVANDY
jgi:hypothetical protein